MKKLISIMLLLSLVFCTVNISGNVWASPDGKMSYTEEDLEEGKAFNPFTTITIKDSQTHYAAQSFIADGAPLTGCRLHFKLVDSATLNIQIRASLDDTKESILYSGSYELETAEKSKVDWWNFEFNRPVGVEKGKTYYLVAWSDFYHNPVALTAAVYLNSPNTNKSYRKAAGTTEWKQMRNRSFGYEIYSNPNVEAVGYPRLVSNNVIMLHNADEYYCLNRADRGTDMELWGLNRSEGFYSMKLSSTEDTGSLGAYIDFDKVTNLSNYNIFYADIYLKSVSGNTSLEFTLFDEQQNSLTYLRTNDLKRGWNKIVWTASEMNLSEDEIFNNFTSLKISVKGTFGEGFYACVDNVRAAKTEIPLLTDGYYTATDLESVGVRSELGDVNADGSVTSADALMALQSSVGSITLCASEFISADVNTDILTTSFDALAILQYSVGKISSIGAPPPLQVEDFVLETNGLEQNTIYTITSNTIADTTEVMPHDFARLVSSFQGLINRETARTRVALVIEDPYSDTWISYVEQNDTLLNGMNNRIAISTLDEFIEIFKNQLIQCGMILWDPNAPSTANVAQTICGLDGYLPVKYLEGDSTLVKKLQNIGVEVKMTLVDKFTGKGIIPDTNIASTGSKKNDPYIWALQKYSHRCSEKYLVYTPDGASSTEGNIIYENDIHSKSLDYNHSFGYDYAVIRKAFCFDLTADESEPPCDDPEQVTGTDVQTLEKIFVNRYYRAYGEFGEVVGFPPWPIKYTSHNGWNTIEATGLEGKFTSFATRYNNYLDADGSIANCSIYCQFEMEESYTSLANSKEVTEVYDPDTVYLYMYTGDYDSAAWSLTHLYNAYNDPSRGSIPITWSITPGLADRIPVLFDYLYKNQTDMDYFSASDSGVGYFRPHELFKSEGSRTLPDGDKEMIKISLEYFEKFDMDSVGFIIGRLSDKVCTFYNQFAPVGNNTNDSTWSPAVYHETPYIRIHNGIGNPATNDEEMTAKVTTMFNYVQNMKDYNVAGFRTIKYTATQLKETQEAFIEYAAEKDPNTTYKFVDYKTYFEMLKQSTSGKHVLN